MVNPRNIRGKGGKSGFLSTRNASEHPAGKAGLLNAPGRWPSQRFGILRDGSLTLDPCSGGKGLHVEALRLFPHSGMVGVLTTNPKIPADRAGIRRKAKACSKGPVIFPPFQFNYRATFRNGGCPAHHFQGSG